MYEKILVSCDNSEASGHGVHKAIELASRIGSEIVGCHVYAARLHDIRFRQLESGLPAQYQAPEQIEHQRKIHNKLIEQGLVLIGDSFLGEMERTCEAAGVRMRRRLLEGAHFQELIREANGGGYGLVVMGNHGIGRQPLSELGGVVTRAMRGLRCDLLIAKTDTSLGAGRYLVCVDGSSYSYAAMQVSLELARNTGAKLYVCSAFDGAFHQVVFDNIKGVLSQQAAKVFKFEQQEELHNSIIDKSLLKLAQANIKRAQVMAQEYPEVDVEAQVLVGKPFQVILQWADEIDPSLLIVARHGAHRVEGSHLGSQAENLVRLANTDVLLVGAVDARPDEIPWIEEDGETGLEWAPEAEVRILRAPPFAQGIARKVVEEHVLEKRGEGDSSLPVVTLERLDEAIRELLPTHMQLIMGIGTGEELALAELKAEEAMQRTVVAGHDADPAPDPPMAEARHPAAGCPGSWEKAASDGVVWTAEAFERLQGVPLLARPLARNTVERFAEEHGLRRVTTRVMDENKEAMIEADEFDADTMLMMFKELQAKQLRVEVEGTQSVPPEMRRFVDEAKATRVTRCPIRQIETGKGKCPSHVDTGIGDGGEAPAQKSVVEECERKKRGR